MFSTHLHRKWVSEWVGKKVSSIVFKVIGNIVCLFCFVSGQIHFKWSYIQYICIEMRCHSGWMGGGECFLFDFDF